jgi:archaetidylinositol phosphate synthase
MNLTSFRYRFTRYIEPVADIFVKLEISPNIITVLSILAGVLAGVFMIWQSFLLGSIVLFISATFDLVDGAVARRIGKETKFGAVFDWIADKYVDCFVLLCIGLSGIPIISMYLSVPALADFGIVACAIIGSMMNTFIKPVTYAEIGFEERVDGKICDPLEGIGFFGRPETILLLCLGGALGYIWLAVLIIAFCTNLSALQRIVYLYRRFS